MTLEKASGIRKKTDVFLFYSEVGERGEADIAFKAHLSGGGEINVGILLEHKSKQEKSVLNSRGMSFLLSACL